MQGPKLKVVVECGNCEFLKQTQLNDKFCDKLNIKLRTNNNLSTPPDKNCPYLEENYIEFHNESLFQLHENREEKLKKKIESIFSDFKFEKLTMNEIHLSIEEVTDFHISEIQKELSQYNFKIERASDDVNLILTLTRKE